MYVGSVGTTYRTTMEDFGGFHGNYICMTTFLSLYSEQIKTPYLWLNHHLAKIEEDYEF